MGVPTAAKARLLLGTSIVVLAIAFAGLRSHITNTVLTHELEVAVAPGAPLALLAVGDTGTGKGPQRQVAQLMERLCVTHGIRGVLLLGDNFYPGGVSGATDPQWRSAFLDMYNSPCLARTPFYAVFGNHDYRGNLDAQVEFTGHTPPQWTMPARYYRIRFGALLDVYMADSNLGDWCGLRWCSVDWLLDRAQHTTSRWRVLAAHHPLLSASIHPRARWPERWTFAHLICAGHIDAYFAGHEHNLQHLRSDPDEFGCAFDQFVAGGGGARVYPILTPSLAQFAQATHGVALIEASAAELRVRFFSPENAAPLYTAAKRGSFFEPERLTELDATR